jgi:hypothetical protein
MRPMSPERRDKAQVALLFWSPPALARLREAAPPPNPAAQTEALQDVSAGPAMATAETPPVAPSP